MHSSCHAIGVVGVGTLTTSTSVPAPDVGESRCDDQQPVGKKSTNTKWPCWPSVDSRRRVRVSDRVVDVPSQGMASVCNPPTASATATAGPGSADAKLPADGIRAADHDAATVGVVVAGHLPDAIYRDFTGAGTGLNGTITHANAAAGTAQGGSAVTTRASG